MLKQFFATLGIIILLQPPLVWGSSGSTKFPAGSKRYNTTLVVPNSSLTDVLTTDTEIYQLSVANITGGACTLLVKDRQATALTIIPTTSLAANTITIYHWPEGYFASGGVQWQAGTGSCLHAQFKAAYK